MGNQPSSRAPTPAAANRTSPSATSSHAPSAHHHDDRPVPAQAPAHNPRRRESIQALSTAKAHPAPPSVESIQAFATARPPAARPPSRGRSQTAAATAPSVASTLRAAQDHFKSPSAEKMGNEQSRQRPKGSDRDPTPPKKSRAAGQPAPVPPASQLAPAPAPAPSPSPSPSPAPAPAPAAAPAPSPQTLPVDVPAAPREERPASRTSGHAASLAPADAPPGAGDGDGDGDVVVPSSHYSRPPRLPLPIEQEVVTPGSPIISPADVSSPIAHDEIEGAFPRRSSMLSSTTAADDDELSEEFKGPEGQPTVPTVIEWESQGERVYVTGTFAGWNRKYRLHQNGPSKKKNVLSAYVHITPGTHHLMFIVDNDMKTSDKLPTAVDYTNILVNYIEVSYDDVPKTAEGPAEEKKQPDPVPVQEQSAPQGVYPPQTLPPTPELQPIQQPVPEPPKPNVPEESPKKYHQTIPRFLLHLDAPEESPRWVRANTATNSLPTPPSLPMFLGKSILNGSTPMKDDSSVLVMPNHTVLNHLATSSIKDNILATSATTRYKHKFLTTIMYKPKQEGPDREF